MLKQLLKMSGIESWKFIIQIKNSFLFIKYFVLRADIGQKTVVSFRVEKK